ncbi:hypothetical protein ABFS82_10G157300 [Erythranthe guttata]
MESSNSSPNYMRATSRFDPKKEYSPEEESDCDEMKSINKIKHTTNNKKPMKNFGSVKSFRRRVPKSRIPQSPSHSSTVSDFDSSESSSSSPNYLKATSSSKGKNTSFQTSPLRVSDSPKPKPKTLSRTSSRNVRVLIKKASFKPKRSPLSSSDRSNVVSVDRATHSSILKDSTKFPKLVEDVHSERAESEEVSRVKICRYQHCSLHGHCHGDHENAVPPLKKFVYKRRLSMKKQKGSVVPKTEPSGKKKINILQDERQTVTIAEPWNQELGKEVQIQDSGLFEVAFGEISFPERSYRDSLEIIGKYSLPEFGLNGYCLKCSCSIINVNNNEKPPNEVIITNEESNTDCRKTPVKVDEATEEKSVFSYSQTSSDNNSGEEVESIAESNPIRVPKINEDVVEGVKENQERGSKLVFSKPRHVSMWHLIHQHMSSSSSSPENKLSENDDSLPAMESADSDVGPTENAELEIEVRKLFAIKLVRQAIEKILLPEIQDQSSDDMSVTSEDTPRSEPVEENQNKEFDADKGEMSVQSNPKEESVVTDDVRKSEKKAPKHWSNLKKWILLQRFIRALEKVKTFNPKKPKILPLNPDPESEKVNLRRQTVDQRKNSEEWMLDYAIRQAVSELAPTQKRKVALLVRAFETVVPSEEEYSPVQSRTSKLKEYFSEGNERNEVLSDNGCTKPEEPSSITTESLILDDDGGKSVANEITADERERVAKPTLEAIQEDERERVEGVRDEREREVKPIQEDEREREADKPTLEVIQEDERESDHQSFETDKKSRIKMWHMIYQHVVSGIVEKVGNQLLDGSDDDASDELSPAAAANDLRNGLTKSDALKLVKEAVDEILLPEDSSNIQKSDAIVSGQAEEVPKAKNWRKLKKLMLLKRSIRALEKGRIVKPQPVHHHPSTVDIEAEKIDLRRQMSDERKKAEEWMIDYAVRNIVTKLTPARKRRVSMLVEAFEAVVPLPEM